MFLNYVYASVKRFRWGMISIMVIGILSCNKLVQVSAPLTTLTEASVYSSDETAIAGVTGIYAALMGLGGMSGVSLDMGLSADELTVYTGTSNIALNEYYKNALNGNNVSSGNGAGIEYWNAGYNYIYATNLALENLKSTSNLTATVQTQLIGETEFMRAFFYFYMVNMYGSVPLLTKSDYKVNQAAGRAAVDSVYSQIIEDLKDAEAKLSDNFLDGTLLQSSTERVRPTKWAAEALLARVYLYLGQYDKAEAAATTVLNQSSLFSLESLDRVFLANNNEAIFQLQPVTGYFNTPEAQEFIIPPSGPFDGSVLLSTNLLNSFEAGDQRRAAWVDSVVTDQTYYFPYKYKVYDYGAPITEYTVVLRLAEIYLIRAEARAQENNLSGAAADLNAIRMRAGLTVTAASAEPDLLAAIIHERQIELFSEWGHRWFDLKRTGLANSVMGAPGNVCAQKGGTWSPDWQLYPIPLSDIKADNKLTQNQGY